MPVHGEHMVAWEWHDLRSAPPCDTDMMPNLRAKLNAGGFNLLPNRLCTRRHRSGVCQAAVVDVQLLAMLPHVHDHMEMGTSDTIYQLTQQSNALVSSQLTGTPPESVACWLQLVSGHATEQQQGVPALVPG